MVPIDQPRVQPAGSRDDEDVDRPQISVQQRLRPTEPVDRLCAMRQLASQVIDSLQQAIVQVSVLGRRPTPFERITRVAHVGLAKMDAEIAAVQPDFSEQRMSGEARVKPCNQLDRRAHTLAVDRTAIELTRAEVVVDMPDAAAAAFGDAPEQCRAVIAHADGRQPAFADQLAAARDRGAETFDDHPARAALDIEAQAEDARRARLQHRLLDQAAVYVATVQQLLQQTAQLGQPWLTLAFEQSVQAPDHDQLRRSALSTSVISRS